jgi:hypothetical protein
MESEALRRVSAEGDDTTIADGCFADQKRKNKAIKPSNLAALR